MPGAPGQSTLPTRLCLHATSPSSLQLFLGTCRRRPWTGAGSGDPAMSRARKAALWGPLWAGSAALHAARRLAGLTRRRVTAPQLTFPAAPGPWARLGGWPSRSRCPGLARVGTEDVQSRARARARARIPGAGGGAPAPRAALPGDTAALASPPPGARAVRSGRTSRRAPETLHGCPGQGVTERHFGGSTHGDPGSPGRPVPAALAAPRK